MDITMMYTMSGFQYHIVIHSISYAVIICPDRWLTFEKAPGVQPNLRSFNTCGIMGMDRVSLENRGHPQEAIGCSRIPEVPSGKLSHNYGKYGKIHHFIAG